MKIKMLLALAALASLSSCATDTPITASLFYRDSDSKVGLSLTGTPRYAPIHPDKNSK